MSDIINIDQFETIENIEISVFPTYNEININRISGGGGSGAVSSVNGQIGDVVLVKSDLGLSNVDNTSDVNKPISSATQTALDLKVDKVTGKGLSTNDYTTVEKTKLSGIQDGAEVNVNADWNATSGDAMILNKPTFGVGDMLKSVYDKDNSGIVDNAEAIVIIGRNATGTTLRRGTIVYISGSTGNRPNFVKAQANSEATSAGTFGVISDDIANNDDGNCCVIGFLDNLDTRSIAPFPFTNDTLADGDTIYLSPTTAGYITNVKPSAPNHLVYIGKVTRTSPTNGTIVYRVQNGYELNEIHDVAITSVADKQLLSYDNATSLWKNKSVTTADISDSAGKRYQSENQNTFNDATSSIQSQLNNKQPLLGYTPYRFNKTTEITHTGTTAKTILQTILIPANTFSNGDFIDFSSIVTKVANISNTAHTIEINITNTLTGASLLANVGFNTTNFFMKFKREFIVNGGNIYAYTNQVAFTPNDQTIGTVANTINSFTYNLAQDLYFFITCTLSNATDSITYRGISLTKK